MTEIRTEKEFLLLMEKIDHEMIVDKIPIKKRLIEALIRVSKLLKISFPILGFEIRKPQEKIYYGWDLTLRIKSWFDNKHGSKQEIDYTVGRLALELAGDVYTLNIPTLYGTANIVSDKNNITNKSSGFSKSRLIINALDMIEGITPQLASYLSNEECYQIGKLFKHGLYIFIHEPIISYKYLNIARNDLCNSTKDSYNTPLKLETRDGLFNSLLKKH